MRPEIIRPLRNEGYPEGWLQPDPTLSYGVIACEESNLELLKSLGVRVSAYDSTIGSVMVEVPPQLPSN